MEQTCSRCGNHKPISQFGIRKKDGLPQKTCLSCLVTCKRWIVRNPDKYRKLMRDVYGPRYRKKHPLTKEQKKRKRSYNREYRSLHLEELRSKSIVRSREWYYKVGKKRTDTPKNKFKTYQTSSRRSGREFSLTFEQFMTFWNQPCFYCGDSVFTVGIDRKDNNIGYVIDNCAPCCAMCNWMKRTFPVADFIRQCKKIASNHILPLT